MCNLIHIFKQNTIFRTLHIKALQMYLHLGMKLRKVHRVIQFEKGVCMAQWVNFCTSKRAQAKSEFEKQFWKLMVRIQTYVVINTIRYILIWKRSKKCRRSRHFLTVYYNKNSFLQLMVFCYSLKTSLRFFSIDSR